LRTKKKTKVNLDAKKTSSIKSNLAIGKGFVILGGGNGSSQKSRSGTVKPNAEGGGLTKKSVKGTGKGTIFRGPSRENVADKKKGISKRKWQGRLSTKKRERGPDLR